MLVPSSMLDRRIAATQISRSTCNTITHSGSTCSDTATVNRVSSRTTSQN
jgi:hypothetical protein